MKALLLILPVAGTFVSGQEKAPDVDPEPALAYFVGGWDVHLTFKLPDGSEGEGRAACEAVLILDGGFLQQEYTSTFRGQRLVKLVVVLHHARKRGSAGGS